MNRATAYDYSDPWAWMRPNYFKNKAIYEIKHSLWY